MAYKTRFSGNSYCGLSCMGTKATAVARAWLCRPVGRCHRSHIPLRFFQAQYATVVERHAAAVQRGAETGHEGGGRSATISGERKRFDSRQNK